MLQNFPKSSSCHHGKTLKTTVKSYKHCFIIPLLALLRLKYPFLIDSDQGKTKQNIINFEVCEVTCIAISKGISLTTSGNKTIHTYFKK